jgi:YD repeat-containing protein
MRNIALIRLRSLVLLTIASFLFLPGLVMGQQGGTARYLYDDNGRLTAVLLPNGEASLYNYDAAGNLVSISRQVSTVLLVLDFTPKFGVEGISVAVYGTGFSTNPSENIVSFNGAPATISSSSLTEIIVTVPVGATTGPITVTTPLGTVMTTSIFTFLQLPTITDFTPEGGSAGSSVIISGTNFETFPRDSEIKFNGVSALATSVTSTEIVALVPLTATTGRISVTTSAGTATSDRDFFVPPVGYPNVTVAGPIAFGELKNFTLSSGKAALFVFQGTAGHIFSLNLFNASFSFFADVSILAPDDSVLVPPTPTDFIYRGLFIEPLSLPATGTYKILVDTSRQFASGSVSLQIFDVPADATGTIIFPGEASITNTVPGQNSRLTFTGTAGDRVNIVGNVTPVGQSEAGAFLSVYRPDGSLLVSPRFMSRTSVFGQQPAFIDNLLLPSDGIYSILVDPSYADLVTSTVSVTGPPPDVVTTIVPGGAAVTVTTIVGQNARATFDGTAGQRVSLGFSNVSIPVSRVSILNPSNGTMVFDFIYSGGSVRFFDTLTLPTTGTFTVLVDPLESYAGNMTLTLYDVPPDVSDSLSIGGPSLTVSINTPGQNAQITFAGTTGQHVSLNITSVSISNSNVYIYSPNGSPLVFGTYVSFGGLLISNLTLPADGTYRIVVDPFGSAVGSMTLSVYDFNLPEITGTITSDGTPLDLDFPQPEQNARISFEATAGQKLILSFSDVTVLRTRVSLFLPNGSIFSGPALITPPSGELIFENLPVTGTYQVLIDPQLAYIGGMRLTLIEVVDTTGSFEINGPAVTITTTPAQNARLTFSGAAGQRLFLNFINLTIPESFVTILNPNGTTLIDNIRLYGNGGSIDVQTLPTTGSYTLLIDPSNFFAGSATLQATETGGITLTGLPVTVVVTTSQETAPLTYSGTGGEKVNLFIFDNTISSGTISIYRPDGTLLTSSALSSIFNQTLPTTGTYSITITPNSGNTGRVTLVLSPGGGGSGDTD